MKPAVSIIVPVYNGEKTLERCVDSVLKQEYKDFELFLINDGSSDKTREICERYAAADDRVLVIHKENSGVSESRNMAIAQAHGEYLQFLDCDDWITPDATKLLVRAAKEEQADLVIADFYRVIGERLSHKGDIEIDGVMDQEAFVGCMMEKPADFYYGVRPWLCAYCRRSSADKKPVRQALVSSTGTFWDTVVVCLMTGLVLVTSIMKNPSIDMSNITGRGILTTLAFQQIPVLGPFILVVGIISFAYSTVLGWAYYGERCVEYFAGKAGLIPYRVVYIIVAAVAPVVSLNLVWTVADILNALMAIPNLVAVLLLSNVIVKETKKIHK